MVKYAFGFLVVAMVSHIPAKSRMAVNYVTGRPYVRCEIEGRLSRVAIFVSIEPKEDDVLRYLRERFRKDTMPGVMNETLERDIMKSILETSSKTYAEVGTVRKLFEGTF